MGAGGGFPWPSRGRALGPTLSTSAGSGMKLVRLKLWVDAGDPHMRELSRSHSNPYPQAQAYPQRPTPLLAADVRRSATPPTVRPIRRGIAEVRVATLTLLTLTTLLG
jgi:hypothetical protein